MTSAPAANGSQLSVTERMARLLGVIPWVVEQGGARLDDIAARFDYPSEQLLEDLTQRLFFVGVHPFTPDTLIEVNITDGMVDIRYADWFSKPMQLTGEEATRLLAAGRSVLDMSPPGGSAGDSDEAAAPLVRALAKLSLSLGASADAGARGLGAASRIDVCLGQAPAETLAELRRAVSTRRRIEIEYYSQGRDAMTARAVDPARLVSHDGAWYLFGWCHRAGAERVFRVDRIRSLEVTDTPAEVEPPAVDGPALSTHQAERTATVRLSPEAGWAADYFSALERTEGPDGSIDATFAVTGDSWLARLLVLLGPGGELIRSHESIDGDLRRVTATRMLQRYRR